VSPTPRYCGACWMATRARLGHQSVEAEHQRRLGPVDLRRRLQDKPRRAVAFREADQLGTFLCRRRADGDDERRAPGCLPGRALNNGPLLSEIELLNLGRKTQNRDAVWLQGKAGLDLSVHGAYIQRAVLVEERIQDRDDFTPLGHLRYPAPRRGRRRIQSLSGTGARHWRPRQTRAPLPPR
jgi:hypothetical protein